MHPTWTSMIAQGDSLVEEPATSGTATEAHNLLILDREVVIVGDLVSFVDDLFRVYDDLLAVADGQDLGCAVWCTAMIDESPKIAFHGSINDHIVIDSAGRCKSAKAIHIRRT